MTIPIAYWLDALTIEQLYVVAFLTGTLSVLFFVSYSTLFVSLVSRERYVEGTSLLNGSRAFSVHRGTRPCVVLPLPESWDELRGSLKRNVKESIRRSTNRLGRDGHTFEVVDEYGSRDELRDALGELRRPHPLR